VLSYDQGHLYFLPKNEDTHTRTEKRDSNLQSQYVVSLRYCKLYLELPPGLAKIILVVKMRVKIATGLQKPTAC